MAAVQLVPHQRVLRPEGGHAVGEDAGGEELSAADGDGALQVGFLAQEVPFRPVGQSQDLLSPPLEHHAVLGEDDVVVAPLEQLHPQLLLQLRDLPGQGWLGHVQLLGRLCEVFLPRYGQEVVEYP